jgi:transketolase
MSELLDLGLRIRRTVLEQSKRAHVGHIGSSLSVADLLASLYGRVLSGAGPERDRLILSKGHAALALYAALAHTGRLDPASLDEFCTDGSVLGTHPEHLVEGVDFSTGSLGHGLSIGAGAALAARLQHSDRRAFVLLSDAELNEGSVWETVMFAAHHRLGQLVAIVDLNGQQALGRTRDVLDLGDVTERFRAFGWDAREVDGHDPDALAATIDALGPERPHALIARTVFGSGVSFMEGQVPWHYWPMDDEQYAAALAEIGS